MNRNLQKRAAFAWLLLVTLTVNAAETAVSLSNNPFRRPDLTDARVPDEPEKQNDISPVDLELRGTLVSGQDSLANVGGTIIRIGQKVNGFQLVSVGEGSAVLSKNGREVTLTLYEEEESETE